MYRAGIDLCPLCACVDDPAGVRDGEPGRHGVRQRTVGRGRPLPPAYPRRLVHYVWPLGPAPHLGTRLLAQ